MAAAACSWKASSNSLSNGTLRESTHNCSPVALATNWTTILNATTVTLSSASTVTLPPAFQDGAMSNRVHFV